MVKLALAASLASVLLLSACGGGGGGEDEEMIRATITAATTTHFPADCRRLHTEKILEQATKLRGEDAVLRCEEEALLMGDGDVAAGVVVTGVEIEGERASAETAFEGSSYDGQTLELDLRRVDGTWKLDQIAGFVDFDREKLMLEMGREILEAASGSKQTITEASCLVREMDDLDDAQLQALLLDPSPDPLAALFAACASRSQAV